MITHTHTHSIQGLAHINKNTDENDIKIFIDKNQKTIKTMADAHKNTTCVW